MATASRFGHDGTRLALLGSVPRVLAHLSDLHFGAAHAWIAERLLNSLRSDPPDLVVITGDLTQRARVSQFRAAQRFLARLPVPHLVTPGNHDIAPLYHPLRRVLAPFGRYRRFISPRLDGYYVDRELLVLGLNSAAPWRLAEGSLRRRQLEWLVQTARRHAGRLAILATHHPVVAGTEPAARRHETWLRSLVDCSVRVCLSGHLHRSHCGLNTGLYAAGRVLVVHACTATSRWLRGQANAYNRIQLSHDQLRIEVHELDRAQFRPQSRATFTWRAGAWRSETEERSREITKQ